VSYYIDINIEKSKSIEEFEDTKGVIRTVNHMTGNTMTNKKSLKISKG
jgi:hypothetical protein